MRAAPHVPVPPGLDDVRGLARDHPIRPAPHRLEATMLSTGTVMHNPITDEWARLVVSAEETGGAHAVGELWGPPGARPAGRHHHPVQEERFEVLEGRLGYELDGHAAVAGPGEVVVIAPGTVHTWSATGHRPMRARVTVAPAGHFAEMIGALWGLAALGRTRSDGMPRLLDAAVLAEAYGEEIVFASPPPAVQRALVRLVAPIARRRGHRIDDPLIAAATVPPDRWPAREGTAA